MSQKLFVLTIFVILSLPAMAGDINQLAAGREYNVEGVIVEKSAERLRIRSHDSTEIAVVFSALTEIREKKKNPFRSAASYSQNDLILGLNVRVEGTGDTSGALLANKVRFTKDELKVARTISSRVSPVEEQLTEAETRLYAAEDRLDQQTKELHQRSDVIENRVEELDDAFHLARREAKEAQQTADEALRRVGNAEDRFALLDQYEETDLLQIAFDFNSAEISDKTRSKLDELVSKIADREGFLIQVSGFASSDGDAEYNRKLSEKRANNVVDYLVAIHNIPLRRIVRPYGFGEERPIADNSTRDGRKLNRRVEVKVFQNQGLSADKPRVALSEQGVDGSLMQ